jgi:hypothetical protein
LPNFKADSALRNDLLPTLSPGGLGAQDVGTDALADLYNPKPTANIAPITRSALWSHAGRPYSVDYFRNQPETPADDQ